MAPGSAPARASAPAQPKNGPGLAAELLARLRERPQPVWELVEATGETTEVVERALHELLRHRAVGTVWVGAPEVKYWRAVEVGA